MLIPRYKTWRQDIISDFYRVLQLLMLAMSSGFLSLRPGSIFTDLINPSRTKLWPFFAIKTSTCDYIPAGSLLITIADNQKYTRPRRQDDDSRWSWSRSWCEKWVRTCKYLILVKLLLISRSFSYQQTHHHISSCLILSFHLIYYILFSIIFLLPETNGRSQK